MMPAPCRTRRLERGFASWVTVLLLLGLLAAAYAAVVFVPPAVLHYEVKHVVHDYANRAVMDPDNQKLVAAMVEKIRVLDEVEEVDAQGKKTRVPVVDLRPEDVTWERTASPPSLHVTFEYSRILKLPFMERTIERVYVVDITNDLTRPNWGPAR
jgi:hypothetical protein